jgi:hypothetical protein
MLMPIPNPSPGPWLRCGSTSQVRVPICQRQPGLPFTNARPTSRRPRCPCPARRSASMNLRSRALSTSPLTLTSDSFVTCSSDVPPPQDVRQERDCGHPRDVVHVVAAAVREDAAVAAVAVRVRGAATLDEVSVRAREQVEQVGRVAHQLGEVPGAPRDGVVQHEVLPAQHRVLHRLALERHAQVIDAPAEVQPQPDRIPATSDWTSRFDAKSTTGNRMRTASDSNARYR